MDFLRLLTDLLTWTEDPLQCIWIASHWNNMQERDYRFESGTAGGFSCILLAHVIVGAGNKWTWSTTNRNISWQTSLFFSESKVWKEQKLHKLIVLLFLHPGREIFPSWQLYRQKPKSKRKIIIILCHFFCMHRLLQDWGIWAGIVCVSLYTTEYTAGV